MNLIYILISMISIAIPNTIYTLPNGNPIVTINAVVTTQDGTKTELNNIKLDRGTDYYIYIKPATLSTGTSELQTVRLDVDPIHHKMGPQPLATTKTIIFLNPKTTYIYEAAKTNTKKEFREVEIDGTPYLMYKSETRTLEGTDANRKQHTIDIDIIKSIEIISACAKPSVPA